jgi:hypothetical protein
MLKASVRDGLVRTLCILAKRCSHRCQGEVGHACVCFVFLWRGVWSTSRYDLRAKNEWTEFEVIKCERGIYMFSSHHKQHHTPHQIVPFACVPLNF